MFDMNDIELKEIDRTLEGKLDWAKTRSAETEQLAMDASRLLSCSETRLQEYAGQGFFKRCWYHFSGENAALERATQDDLLNMQKYAWRYINILQERDLMLAYSIIVVKNNLKTLAFDQQILKTEVARLADRVYERFIALEQRMDNQEASQRIHSWLLTIETREYDDQYPECLRLLKVVDDFYALKSSSWSVQELRYLQTAIRTVGISTKKMMSISEFIEQTIDEIDMVGYEKFSSIVRIPKVTEKENDFFIENISSPVFNAINQIKDNYNVSSRVIHPLQRRMGISHAEAIKFVLTDFIDEVGIETDAELFLKDIAIEILACLSLSKRLYEAHFNQPQQVLEAPAQNQPSTTTQVENPLLLTESRKNQWEEVRIFLHEYATI